MLRDLTEVLHMRTNNHRFAENGWLQNVMATPIGQRSAHEHHRCVWKQSTQFPDTVEQQDICAGIVERAAPRPTQSGSFQKLRRRLEAFRLARRHDQTPARKTALS